MTHEVNVTSETGRFFIMHLTETQNHKPSYERSRIFCNQGVGE